jgi:predicted metal-binding membrane protein
MGWTAVPAHSWEDSAGSRPTWVLMMAAMMLPAMAPSLRMWDAERRRRATRWRQIVGPITTVVAYLAVWTLAGALTYLVLRAGRSLLGETLQWHRGGHELCVAVIVVAAAYQLTHAKDRWLARCHAPAISADATVADGLAAGGRTGLRCLASSWALMAALFALGAMSLVWMAVVAGLIGGRALGAETMVAHRRTDVHPRGFGYVVGRAGRSCCAESRMGPRLHDSW